MIVPSIDIVNGRAVQLRRGKELVLDGGNPIERLEEFAIAGEVAVVDLDAALGRGSNAELIRDLEARLEALEHAYEMERFSSLVLTELVTGVEDDLKAVPPHIDRALARIAKLETARASPAA